MANSRLKYKRADACAEPEAWRKQPRRGSPRSRRSATDFTISRWPSGSWDARKRNGCEAVAEKSVKKSGEKSRETSADLLIAGLRRHGGVIRRRYRSRQEV